MRDGIGSVQSKSGSLHGRHQGGQWRLKLRLAGIPKARRLAIYRGGPRDPRRQKSSSAHKASRRIEGPIQAVFELVSPVTRFRSTAAKTPEALFSFENETDSWTTISSNASRNYDLTLAMRRKPGIQDGRMPGCHNFEKTHRHNRAVQSEGCLEEWCWASRFYLEEHSNGQFKAQELPLGVH